MIIKLFYTQLGASATGMFCTCPKIFWGTVEQDICFAHTLEASVEQYIYFTYALELLQDCRKTNMFCTYLVETTEQDICFVHTLKATI